MRSTRVNGLGGAPLREARLASQVESAIASGLDEQKRAQQRASEQRGLQASMSDSPSPREDDASTALRGFGARTRRGVEPERGTRAIGEPGGRSAVDGDAAGSRALQEAEAGSSSSLTETKQQSGSEEGLPAAAPQVLARTSAGLGPDRRRGRGPCQRICDAGLWAPG